MSEGEEYIDDPEFTGSLGAVRQHYERLEGVYEELSALGDEYPTIGFAGNDSWYRYTDATEPEAIEAGWNAKGRVKTLGRDWSRILDEDLGKDDRDREIFNIASWKTPESVTEWRYRRWEPEDDENAWEDGEKPTPGYHDLRGFGFWADLDLADKAGRAELTEDQLQAVEKAQQLVIEHVAELYGVDEGDIYALDSGGGSYIYGPPEATLPVSEYLDGDALEWFLNDVRERMRDEFATETVWPAVVEEVPETEELLDPDWIQNVNRQTKAPGAIHHNHDLVVTPLRPRDPETGEVAGSVDYTPTTVSELEETDVRVLEQWATGLTRIEHRDSVEEFVTNLYPELAEADEVDNWRDIVDERVGVLRKREQSREERREAVKERLEEWDGREQEGDALRSAHGQYAGAEVTADRDDVFAAIETIDVRDVVRKHASDAYDTSSRPHETTFDPSWRKSDSGESCAIPNGENNFIDNKVDAGGGPVKTYALGEGIIPGGKEAATTRLRSKWGDAVDAMRRDGYNIPVWVPDPADESNDYDKTPYWAVVKAAVALELVGSEDLVEREGEDGSSYMALGAEDYNATLDALESRGIEHGRRRAETEAEPESGVPIQQLRALNPQERRRAAQKRGLHIPETEEVQDRVADAIDTAVAEERTTVVEAPTGAGKSYHSSTTPWLEKEEAEDAPTLVLTGTKEHRKQNAEKSREAGVTYRQLRGRAEACEVAAGEHDPEAVAEAEEDLQPITIDGVPASQWFDAQCEGKGLPFSVAHKYAEKHNDQDVRLPCHEEGEECLAISQWDGIPRNDEGEPAADVIHATHQFAMVPSLRMHTNLLFDELPDFTIDVGEHGLSHDRVHRMVAAYLDEVGARVTTWEAFVSMANAPGDTDAGAEAEQLERTIQNETPGVEWYFDEPDAHTLAPALTRAIWFALQDEPDANGRRMATVSHEPPRLDRNASDANGWNREWVRVVLDEQNRVAKLWDTPDLSQARAVVGLDARPAMPRWQLNAAPDIDRTRVLDTEERALWRHFEQQKTVVQVGDATRPYTSGEYFDRQGTTALLEHLTEEHGDVPVITAGSVEHEHRDILEDLGVDEPKTMHYGEEKSREDFADEDTLLVNGVIDPGDDLVLDLLAALDKNATPETTEGDDGEEVRAHGRGFDGEDADTAEAILESVRANHVAQAVGRSGRNPDSSERSVVYVRTDVAPPDLVDYKTPGVQWLYGEKQRRILAHVRENPGVSAREVAENSDATKEHVRRTLEKLEEHGMLSVREGAGEYGADLHRLDGDTGENGVADTTIANSPVWEHYTLRLAIDAVHLDSGDTSPASEPSAAGKNARLVQFGVEPPS